MIQRKFETGMYVVNKEYKIVNFNKAMAELYPDVKMGDVCYHALALRDTPCDVCPLENDNAFFYNPIRKEWIYANAAAMDYPQYGECYTVQFQLRQRIEDVGHEMLRQENVDEHIKELSGGNLDVCAIGGYCESGSPLFYANENLLQLLGYDSLEEMHQMIDGLVFNTIHPDDLDRVTRDLTKAAQHGGYFESTYRIRRKDNTWFWIVSRGKRIETQTGALVLFSVIYDMSDFMKRQNELREENEELLRKELTNQELLFRMPGGYHQCAAEKGFPFLYIGTSFEKITGWTRKEIETEFDNLFINLVFPEDIPICMGIVENIEKQGYSNDIYRIKRKGGGYLWVSDSTMRVDSGNECFYHGVLADVTNYVEDMESTRRELEMAKLVAEESSRAKSTFLFNVSHDIRTPMNAIQGFAHMIKANASNIQFVEASAAKIKKSSAVLLQLLNDVLELSRIESGKEKVELQEHDLRKVMENPYLMFANEIEEAGITFEMKNNLKHALVRCDELKCTRILMNMLSNAKKFTPAGGQIVCGIEEVSCDEKTGIYRFFTHDTGIGMSQEFQKRAFDEFERVKTSTDSGKTGSGLGLAIIKRLVNIMGGTYELESELEKGTKISVTLEFPLVEEAKLEEKKIDVKNVNFDGKRILLVEDNEFNREIAHYIFEEIGFEVEEAENGAVCLEKFTTAEVGYYNLILMDIQMPVMDGYTATQKIRSLENVELAKIPIVAMTANAFKEDKEKCIAIGMNGHVGKPFEASAVINELLKVLSMIE